MIGIERQYLRESIQALSRARNSLLRLEAKEAISESDYGKGDSLCLDAVPEIAIIQSLCEDFDPHFVIITEEIGSSESLHGTEEQVYSFCDPMDRSKILRDFLKNRTGKLENIFSDHESIIEWEENYGGNIELTGPYGSITVIRNKQIIFNVMINYFTGLLYIACEDGVGYFSYENLFEDSQWKLMKRTRFLLEDLNNIIYSENLDENKYLKFVTFCNGKKYKDNLLASKLFLESTIDEIQGKYLLYDKPGGPARILYLKNPSEVGFILSNGEKISEWLGWLAYVKHSWPKLRAYEISFDSSWTRDQILMAPGPAYSIIGEKISTKAGRTYKFLEINIQKLKYLENPSRYRATILICPECNEEMTIQMSMQKCIELKFKKTINNII